MKPERKNFLASVLVTAVEGGIDYWADVGNYTWAQDDRGNLTGASVEVKERDERELTDKWIPIDLKIIAAGISSIKSGKVNMNPKIVGYVTMSDVENDASEVDSEVADCIVQAALFGQLVYG